MFDDPKKPTTDQNTDDMTEEKGGEATYEDTDMGDLSDTKTIEDDTE